MSFFEKLFFSSNDKALFQKIRKLSGVWSTSDPLIKEFRLRLLELQNWRCVYCQAPISSNENGFRELEHILPKSATKNYSKLKASSNNVLDRRVTAGYPAFKYEPKNLAVSCKQCNTGKGTYDPLRDRTKIPVLYPREQKFEWYHPHFHIYQDYISLDPDTWIYSKVKDEGERVIIECKLDKAATLARKFLVRAIVRTRHIRSSGLSAVLFSLATSIVAKEFGLKHAKLALEAECKLTPVEAHELLRLWINRVKDDTIENCDKAQRALTTVHGRLTSVGISVKSTEKKIRQSIQ